MRIISRSGVLLLLPMLAPPGPAGSPAPLRFEVTVAAGLLPRPTDGRLLIVLARKKSPEPRLTIGTESAWCIRGERRRARERDIGRIEIDEVARACATHRFLEIAHGNLGDYQCCDRNKPARQHE